MMMPSILGGSLFHDFWDDSFPRYSFPDISKTLYGKQEANLMKTDIKETEGAYELEVDLPGFKKEEINVKLEDGYLTISTARELNQEDKTDKYLRKERYQGSMSRSFYVGSEIEQNDIRAKFEDGILKLTVPKTDPEKVAQNKYIAIEG